ncbi:MAG: hypothetical protein K0S74_383 [Chlamydiales bacterium]|jgi:hypothetical protein|nr:hypothetical protein [Chlamydiales bacterium]
MLPILPKSLSSVSVDTNSHQESLIPESALSHEQIFDNKSDVINVLKADNGIKYVCQKIFKNENFIQADKPSTALDAAYCAFQIGELKAPKLIKACSDIFEKLQQYPAESSHLLALKIYFMKSILKCFSEESRYDPRETQKKGDLEQTKKIYTLLSSLDKDEYRNTITAWFNYIASDLICKPVWVPFSNKGSLEISKVKSYKITKQKIVCITALVEQFLQKDDPERALELLSLGQKYKEYAYFRINENPFSKAFFERGYLKEAILAIQYQELPSEKTDPTTKKIFSQVSNTDNLETLLDITLYCKDLEPERTLSSIFIKDSEKSLQRIKEWKKTTSLDLELSIRTILILAGQLLREQHIRHAVDVVEIVKSNFSGKQFENSNHNNLNSIIKGENLYSALNLFHLTNIANRLVASGYSVEQLFSFIQGFSKSVQIQIKDSYYRAYDQKISNDKNGSTFLLEKIDLAILFYKDSKDFDLYGEIIEPCIEQSLKEKKWGVAIEIATKATGILSDNILEELMLNIDSAKEDCLNQQSKECINFVNTLVDQKDPLNQSEDDFDALDCYKNDELDEEDYFEEDECIPFDDENTAD